jgi:hypothetical protein
LYEQQSIHTALRTSRKVPDLHIDVEPGAEDRQLCQKALNPPAWSGDVRDAQTAFAEKH